MSESRRPLFRATALERYVRRRDRVVLPRYIHPSAVRPLWIVLALLLGASGVGAAAPVPDLVPGVGSLAEAAPSATARSVAITVAPSDRARIQVGQTVTIRTPRGVAVRTTIVQADGVRIAVNLPADQPAPTASLPAGATLTAEIEVGTRPAWTLLIPRTRDHDV